MLENDSAKIFWPPRCKFSTPYQQERTSPNLGQRLRLLLLGFLIALGEAFTLVSSAWAEQEVTTRQASNGLIFVSILILFALVGVAVFYMVYLQRHFLNVCRDNNQLTTFLEAPAGLPPGTVRSVLTLLIVSFSLYLLVLAAFNIGAKLPDALAAILSTVIGFYFGSRTAKGAADQAQQEQVRQLETARDQAVTDKEEGQTSTLLKKIQKGLAMTKIAAQLLPENIRKKYGGTIAKLEQGVTTVESLTKIGDSSAALSKADQIFTVFKEENPVRDLFQKATTSFGRVLSTAVPAAALISTVVVIGTKLVGAAYEKWRARVLHAPFSPAVIPLQVVDANTGFTLLLKCPIFKAAFKTELEANDRPFMTSAMHGFLGGEKTEALWTKYKDRFESRGQFETGLEEFRRAVADLELRQDIEPQLLTEVGGYDELMRSIDQLNADPEARADLDGLVTITEGLQENGEPVRAIFDKVREEVS